MFTFLLFCFGLVYTFRWVDGKIAQHRDCCPNLNKLIEQEERDAWTQLGEKEVELFLAPYTTPDEQPPVLPDLPPSIKIAPLTREERVALSVGINCPEGCTIQRLHAHVDRSISEHTDRNCSQVNCSLAHLDN